MWARIFCRQKMKGLLSLNIGKNHSDILAQAEMNIIFYIKTKR